MIQIIAKGARLPARSAIWPTSRRRSGRWRSTRSLAVSAPKIREDRSRSHLDAVAFASTCYSVNKRTAVKLDPDVNAAIEQLRKRSNLGVSETVNQLIRRDLNIQVRHPRFIHPTQSGPRQTVDVETGERGCPHADDLHARRAAVHRPHGWRRPSGALRDWSTGVVPLVDGEAIEQAGAASRDQVLLAASTTRVRRVP